MATQWDTTKDMLVLLAIIHISKIDVNLDVAERIVAGWPAAMGKVPADAEGILCRVGEIWQKSIRSVAPSTLILPTPTTVEKESSGSCSTEAIIIDDDDEIDTQNTPAPTYHQSRLPRKPRVQTTASLAALRNTKKCSIEDDKDDADTPNTPVAPPPLSRAFRVPPGASLVTPRSIKKKSTPQKAKVVVEFEKGDGEKKSTKNDAVKKHNTFLPTPESEINITNNANKTRTPRKKPKLRISTIRKTAEAHDNSETDKENVELPRTIATTRKRRRGLDYTASPSDYCYDNADDDDYELEDVEGDDRLEAIFESSCPVITPSKRQKKR